MSNKNNHENKTLFNTRDDILGETQIKPLRERIDNKSHRIDTYRKKDWKEAKKRRC